MIHEASYYARMAAGLYRYLRTPPIRDVAEEVQQRLLGREEAFLATARDVIFADRDNPYHRLLRAAGCTYSDLEAAVREQGLESALDALYRQGVYLSHDEFKGKVPVQRTGLEFSVTPDCFANPLAKGAIETSTSGSRSSGTKTYRSVEFIVYREAQETLLKSLLGLHTRPSVGLFHSLPATSGLRRSLMEARQGDPMEKWFTVAGHTPDARLYRAMTGLLTTEARLMAVRSCWPTYLPPNDFRPVAEWLARRRAEGAPCLVIGGVSRSVRVADAAIEGGLDIEGTAFIAGGEALTPAKRASIERTGSEVFSLYVIVEFGLVGFACRRLREENGVHVTRDSVAVIGRRRRAPLSGTEVNSLLLTTLLPFAPLVLINTEMDDAGILDDGRCDCPLAAFGYHQRILRLYSYGKLTGSGTTLEGGDLLRILEEVLPARFGGTPVDYQLVEREGPRQTDIELRVNPRLAGLAEATLREFFLAQVRSLWGGSLTRREWTHTGAFRVVLAEPLTTKSGKVLPLHLLSEGPPQET